MYRILIVSITALIVGCSSGDEASRALNSAGYKQITITGYRFFGCGKDDRWHTGFEAVGQNGQRVSGVVCSDVFKGATIRLD